MVLDLLWGGFLLIYDVCCYNVLFLQCSKTCEGGFRVREVRCLSDDMLSSDGCDEHLRPPGREDCNPEPCLPHIGQSCPKVLIVSDVEASLVNVAEMDRPPYQCVRQRFQYCY